jgi:hypothetical protein
MTERDEASTPTRVGLSEGLGPLPSAVQRAINAVEGVEAAISGGSVLAMGDALPEAMRDLRDAAHDLAGWGKSWVMPRRKRETLQSRLSYLHSIPHAQRNTYMEAEISALDWVLHRVRA